MTTPPTVAMYEEIIAGRAQPEDAVSYLEGIVHSIAPVIMPDILHNDSFDFCLVGFGQTRVERTAKGIRKSLSENPTFDAVKAVKSELGELKAPHEMAWQENPYKWNDKRLAARLKAGTNYGIIAGSVFQAEGTEARLFIHDGDKPEAWVDAGFWDDLPIDRLRVKTGKGEHNYFVSELTCSKDAIEIGEFGHLKFQHSQCVGPGSLHPSGRRYELIEDHLPAYVDAETLQNAILSAVKYLKPDIAQSVKEALIIKSNASGSRKTETAPAPEQHGDAIQDYHDDTSEIVASNKVEGSPTLQGVHDDLGRRIVEDESLNPCLRRLTAELLRSDGATRFETITSFEGKKGEGEHALRLAWATALIKSGYTDEEIHQLCKKFDDYNQPKTQQQLKDIREHVDSGGNYHTCNNISSRLPWTWCRDCRKSDWSKKSVKQNGPTVIDAIKALDAVCDGAHTQDGTGFNKFDRRTHEEIIEKTLSEGMLSSKEEKAAHKFLGKYKKQLKDLGIDYDNIEPIIRGADEQDDSEEINIRIPVWINEHHFITVADTEKLYHYDHGVYCDDGERVLKARLESEFGNKTNERLVKDVVGKIKRRTYVDRDAFNSKPILNVKNGLLDLDTLKLQPHTPDYLSTAQLDIVYDPNAEAPKIQKFIGEVAQPEDIALVEEIFGWVLWPDYNVHKAIMLLGIGRNGKGTLLRLMTAFLGKRNVSNVTLQDLTADRFAKADLYGKLVNIGGDLPSKDLSDTAAFRNLTGGDDSRAQEKYRPAFNFRNQAKLLFSANVLPRSPDDTYAFYSRWILIEFKNVFDVQKGTGDPDLEAKLTTPAELSGLLNIAIEGLRRLRANAWKFSYSKTVEDVETMYKRNANPVLAFLIDRCEAAPDCYIDKTKLNAEFNKYAKEHNLRPLSTKKFTALLKEQSEIPISDFRPWGERGAEPRAWIGVRLKNLQKNKEPEKKKRKKRERALHKTQAPLPDQRQQAPAGGNDETPSISSRVLPTPSLCEKMELKDKSSIHKVGYTKALDDMDVSPQCRPTKSMGEGVQPANVGGGAVNSVSLQIEDEIRRYLVKELNFQREVYREILGMELSSVQNRFNLNASQVERFMKAEGWKIEENERSGDWNDGFVIPPEGWFQTQRSRYLQTLPEQGAEERTTIELAESSAGISESAGTIAADGIPHPSSKEAVSNGDLVDSTDPIPLSLPEIQVAMNHEKGISIAARLEIELNGWIDPRKIASKMDISILEVISWLDQNAIQYERKDGSIGYRLPTDTASS